MKQFQRAEFKAMREAGIDTDEILDRVHTFYERQEGDIKYETRREYGHRREMIGTAGGWIIGLSVFGAIFGWIVVSTYNYDRYLHACENGNTIQCISLVQSNLSSIENDSVRHLRQEVAHLETAYRLKTGQELPEIK